MTHVPLSMMGSVTMTLTTLATRPTSCAAPNTPIPVSGSSFVSVGTAFESVSCVPCSCQMASAARARDTTVLAAMKTLNVAFSASPAFPSTDLSFFVLSSFFGLRVRRGAVSPSSAASPPASPAPSTSSSRTSTSPGDDLALLLLLLRPLTAHKEDGEEEGRVDLRRIRPIPPSWGHRRGGRCLLWWRRSWSPVGRWRHAQLVFLKVVDLPGTAGERGAARLEERAASALRQGGCCRTEVEVMGRRAEPEGQTTLNPVERKGRLWRRGGILPQRTCERHWGQPKGR